MSLPVRLIQRLKMRDLNILLSLAQWGSMAKTAQQLGTSHSVVSKAIADLEHTVRVRLLDRTSQGVVPTIYGRALIGRVRAAMDELGQGLIDIEFLADPMAGEVRIGCPESMTAGLVPAIIEDLSRSHPRLVVHVVQANTMSSEFTELRERKVELMLGRIATEVSDHDLHVEVLYRDKAFIVASAESPWARRRKIHIADLVGERWVHAPLEGELGSYFARLFYANGLELPPVRVESYSMFLRSNLLATGGYVSILPGSVLRFNAERFSLKALPVGLSHQPDLLVSVVTLKNRTLSPAAELFISRARKQTKS